MARHIKQDGLSSVLVHLWLVSGLQGLRGLCVNMLCPPTTGFRYSLPLHSLRLCCVHDRFHYHGDELKNEVFEIKGVIGEAYTSRPVPSH
jgi:hypothetical protein